MGKAESIKRRKKLEQLNDIDFVLSSEQGRRFLWRVLNYCGVYQDIESENSNATFKKLGKRQVGLYLMGICSERSEDHIFKMMKEAKADKEQEEKEYEQAELERRREEESEGLTTVARGDVDLFI